MTRMISPTSPPGPTPTSRWWAASVTKKTAVQRFSRFRNCARDAVGTPWSRPRSAHRHPHRLDHAGIPARAPYLGDETRETFTPFGVGLVTRRRDPHRRPADRERPGEAGIRRDRRGHYLPLGHDADGEEVLTFAFQPVGA